MIFADGGQLRLFDKRRLGRVRLEPNVDALGPDAEMITREEFRTRVGRGHAPVKARLLDQSVLAGVGNLLADETLWQAELNPSTPADELGGRRTGPALRRAAGGAQGRDRQRRRAHRRGHPVPRRRHPVPALRRPDGHGTVGGRSTWWCSREQRLTRTPGERISERWC